MKSIQVNNYTFHFEEQGSGSPVIFVHGTINDLRTWENQVAPFAQRYQVISYSRRYHYPNETSGNISDYTVSLHANDLIDFIKTLDRGPVNLVTASYGGYAGLLAAIQRPDLVKSLVMGEPPVIALLVSDVDNPLQLVSLLIKDFPTGKSFIRFGIKGLNPAKKEASKGNLKDAVRLFADGVLGEGNFEQLPEEVKRSLLDNAPALKAELLGPGFPGEFPIEDARKLQIPVLFVNGGKSLKFFHTISEKLHKILPNSHQHLISDTTHQIHQENPEAYNKKVLEFLNTNN